MHFWHRVKDAFYYMRIDMQFTWDYEKDHSQQVKYFLKEKGISKRVC